MRRVLAILLLLVFSVPQAFAWGGRGHELIAYIAYQHLTPEARTWVDQLVQNNPCAKQWNAQVKSLVAADRPVALFMLAATWPDKIKPGKTPYTCQPGFVFSGDDGQKVNGKTNPDLVPDDTAGATSALGYTDEHRRHQYWHFIDQPLPPNYPHAKDPSPVNAVGEIKALSEMLKQAKKKGLDDKTEATLASYYMVWLEHLVGDVHQPLHDTQRFGTSFPNGDAGGNGVSVCPLNDTATSTTTTTVGTKKVATKKGCRSSLHSYWDDLPGSSGSLSAVMTQGCKLNNTLVANGGTATGKTCVFKNAPPPPGSNVNDPQSWAADAFALAKDDAYAKPFATGKKWVNPTLIKTGTGYNKQAMKDMKQQVLLAGYRLAALLNGDLK